MKKLTLLILLFTIGCFSTAQTNTFGNEETKSEYFFAYKIMPSMQRELVVCAIIKPNPEGKDYIKYVSTKSWATQLTGYQTSKANPEKENLVLKYEIFEIPDTIISLGEDEVKDYTILRTVFLLNNLWRLRYSEYPYETKGKPEKGWAIHPEEKAITLPSESQMNILRKYGIQELNNFFLHEGALKLLKDFRNRDWQTRYSQSLEPTDEKGSTEENENK